MVESADLEGGPMEIKLSGWAHLMVQAYRASKGLAPFDFEHWHVHKQEEKRLKLENRRLGRGLGKKIGRTCIGCAAYFEVGGKRNASQKYCTFACFLKTR